eukprot:CAMPEP_0201126996 /NCGR_PEP_ID=MMETSP0850-20130426/28373_1 /ASSEMBLY_ACC=CAM_ASM_000622 /TAXON_ID=183588 /ORGANISM="Pseudo-nitzschia fraudulenta, Strain WWA7" /LENGTH=180 /DNA_ID=CAMNT_0047395665 /DNA_START=218 /DNA_END=760 /DNA_ORIENTATION=-
MTYDDKPHCFALSYPVTAEGYDSEFNEIEDLKIDSLTITVWVFAILAFVLGVALVFVAFVLAFCDGSMAVFPGCFPEPVWTWTGVGIAFLVNFVFQGISLLVLLSGVCKNHPVIFGAVNSRDFYDSDRERKELYETLPETCEIAIGYIGNVAATLFWCLAGVCAIAFPPVLKETTSTSLE